MSSPGNRRPGNAHELFGRRHPVRTGSSDPGFCFSGVKRPASSAASASAAATVRLSHAEWNELRLIKAGALHEV